VIAPIRWYTQRRQWKHNTRRLLDCRSPERKGTVNSRPLIKKIWRANCMAMTQLQIMLVRESWEVARKEPLALKILFYERLFYLAPETRAVFQGVGHSKILIRNLQAIVDRLEVLDDSTYFIPCLADEFVPMAVRTAHYSVIGEALLWAIEKRLGGRWNQQIAGAWQTLYDTLTAVVRKVAA